MRSGFLLSPWFHVFGLGGLAVAGMVVWGLALAKVETPTTLLKPGGTTCDISPRGSVSSSSRPSKRVCPPPAESVRAVAIDLTRNELFVVDGSQVIDAFAVGSGSEEAGSATPEGVHVIWQREFCPPYYGQHPAFPIPGCLGVNPLGKGALWFWGREYGIHGTSQPRLLNPSQTTAEDRRVSKGCIRMRNEDIVRLMDDVDVGTPVWVGRSAAAEKSGGAVTVRSMGTHGTLLLVRFGKGTDHLRGEHVVSRVRFDFPRPASQILESGHAYAAYRLPLVGTNESSAFKFRFESKGRPLLAPQDRGVMSLSARQRGQ